MRRAARAALVALIAQASLGCGPVPHSRAGGAVSPLAVRAVAWNAASAPVGKVRAVADGGDVVAVFSDRGATVLASGAAVATDGAANDCAAAGAIAGADGSAQWILGVTSKGKMLHLRGRSAFEDVSDRYGLGGARVLGVTPLGGRYVGLLLPGGVAIADGVHVSRYDGVTFEELTGGGGFGAGVAKDAVEMVDAARGSIARYALPGAAHAAIAPDGRLYAATSRAIYAADPQGKLTLVYDATASTIHGLVASGTRVWFADGDELGVVDGDRVAETTGAKIARDATLASSASGDVWVLASGVLSRFARAEDTPPIGGAWETLIAPIFARSCSACHQPDGVSGTDLSTAAAWNGERAHLVERVVEKRSMPPEGHPLPDADREIIRKWLEGGSPGVR